MTKSQNHGSQIMETDGTIHPALSHDFVIHDFVCRDVEVPANCNGEKSQDGVRSPDGHHRLPVSVNQRRNHKIMDHKIMETDGTILHDFVCRDVEVPANCNGEKSQDGVRSPDGHHRLPVSVNQRRNHKIMEHIIMETEGTISPFSVFMIL
jgi:hypothetical protein